MRTICSWIMTMAIANATYAQEIAVAADAEVYIHPGASISVADLELTPSSGFAWSGLSIQQNTTVTNSFSNPYVSRVYFFNQSTAVFNGDILFRYNTSELNAIPPASLTLIAYNGSSWAPVSSTSDVVNNYVAARVTNLLLSEMTLANASVLPLKWNPIAAVRKSNYVNIKWETAEEYNVSHFDIERSKDAVNWIKAIAGIAAKNQLNRNYYEQTDEPNYYGKLYYRIRQTDRDGRSTTSAVTFVAEEKETIHLSIQPNPATSYFAVSGIDPTEVQKVDLFTTGGTLIKSWRSKQVQYLLPSLLPGIYYVHVQLQNGTSISEKLLVK